MLDPKNLSGLGSGPAVFYIRYFLNISCPSVLKYAKMDVPRGVLYFIFLRGGGFLCRLRYVIS